MSEEKPICEICKRGIEVVEDSFIKVDCYNEFHQLVKTYYYHWQCFYKHWLEESGMLVKTQ